jgi:hypothetical protein
MSGETFRTAGQYAALAICVAGMIFCWVKAASHLREAHLIVFEGFVATGPAPIARAVWITSASNKEHSVPRELP